MDIEATKREIKALEDRRYQAMIATPMTVGTAQIVGLKACSGNSSTSPTDRKAV